MLRVSTLSLKVYRSRIIKAIGSSAGVITEMVPALIAVLGNPPPVPVLPHAEAQARFEHVFTRFLSALAQPLEPLVLFLDDLQWADDPSLKLIRTLLVSVVYHNIW